MSLGRNTLRTNQGYKKKKGNDSQYTRQKTFKVKQQVIKKLKPNTDGDLTYKLDIMGYQGKLRS